MANAARLDEQIEAIGASEEFRHWQERLTACFYDREAKDTLIREVRETVTARARGLSPEEVETLLRAVVARLVGLASRAATRPHDSQDLTPLERTPQAIEDLVVDQFPYPIAVSYSRLVDGAPGGGAFGSLLDTIESWLHYLATVVVSAYWRAGAFDTRHNERLLRKFRKNHWFTGDVMELLRETSILFLNRASDLPYPQLVSYLYTRSGKPTPSHEILNGFVDLRNSAWGHSGGRSDFFYAGILPEHRRRLDEELNRCDWLTTRTLWLPKRIDDDGRVLLADLLKGNRRRKDRELSLHLNPRDLDVHGGDIVPERTLLLVDDGAREYLPLFPLSLFHFQQTGQGLFFLNGLEWKKETEELRKAAFHTYDAPLPNHEARPGDAPVKSLEAKVRQLAGALHAGQALLREIAAEVTAVADYDLREVWAEQASHLKSFVGRDAWLARLRHWVDATAEGGYLLLLGPPGQGKSALMAQFAKEQHDGAGCLLHMVKSHRDPRRILQFLLWQAGRILDEPWGEAVYQGDIDDLRNALVNALEKIRHRYGRALMVIDALDELEPGPECLDFLPTHVPAGVRVILSCRPHNPLVTSLGNRFQALVIEHLPPLTAEDLSLLLEKSLQPEGLRELRRAVDFEALLQRLQGNPLFLKRALGRMLDAAKSARDHGVSIPPMAVGDFQNSLDAVFEEIYHEIAERGQSASISSTGRLKARIIQLLAVGYEPLSLDDLRGLLRADMALAPGAATPPPTSPEFTGSIEEVRDLVAQVSEYLLDTDGDRFLPFHQGFTDYLQQQVLAQDGMATAHEVFCHWLGSTPQHGSPYRLRYLPAHLFAWRALSVAGRLQAQIGQAERQLEALLTDIDFVQAKVQAGMTFDFVREYQAAMRCTRSAAMESWAQFINRQGHILSRQPALFLQQAVNQPGDSPVAQAAALWLDRSPPDQPYVRWLNKPEDTAVSRLLRTMTGHSERVTALAVTPDGRFVASGSQDGTLKLWELESGQEVRTFHGFVKTVNAVAVSPDGRFLIAGGEATVHTVTADGQWKFLREEDYPPTLRVWELPSGREVTRLSAMVGSIRALTAAADMCYAVAKSGTLQKVWRTSLSSGPKSTGWQEVATLDGSEKFLNRQIVCLDGRCVMGADKVAKIWDLMNGQVLMTLNVDMDNMTALAVSPNGRYLVRENLYGPLGVWDLASGQRIATLEAYWMGMGALAISADSRYLVATRSTGELKVWELASRRLVTTFEGRRSQGRALAITPDHRYVVSGGHDGSTDLWDLRAAAEPSAVPWQRRVGGLAKEFWSEVRQQSWREIGYMDARDASAITADGSAAVLGMGVHGGFVWNLATGRKIRSWSGHENLKTAVAVTADRRYVLLGEFDGHLRIWRSWWGEVVKLVAHTSRISAIVVTPDGHLAVSASWDKTLKVWDLRQGQLEHGQPVSAMEGQGFFDKVAAHSLWRGRKVLTLAGHEGTVNAVAALPDGQHVVSASGDRTLKVWSLVTGTEVRTLTGHGGSVTAVAVTPDGRSVVSGGSDNTVRLWDVTTGLEVSRYEKHAPGVTAVAVTQDGRYAVSGGRDGMVKVWELTSGFDVATFPTADAVTACAVDRDGRIICQDEAWRLYILRISRELP